MRIGNVRLHIGHGDVDVKNVTPAECAILTFNDPKGTIGHGVRAGKFPLSSLKITGDAKKEYFDTDDNQWKSTDKLRTQGDEYERLYRKFGRAKVFAVYPAGTAVLPERFAQVQGWEEKDVETVEKDEAPKESAKAQEPEKPKLGSLGNPYVRAEDPLHKDGVDGEYWGNSKTSQLWMKKNGNWEKVVEDPDDSEETP